MATPPVETNSLLREVSESVRSRSSSTNSNDFVIDADTQNALSQIKTKYTGAKCDSEGFYQHEGECWNDAIQMVFLFSDGLKEVVQEKLANNEVDINFIPRESIPRIIDEYDKYRGHERIIDVFAKHRGQDVRKAPADLSPKQIIESLVFYLKFFKNRFARHYTMESERRENELCTLNKNPIHLLHVKGKNGELAAIFGKPSINPDNNITIEKYKKNDLAGANQPQMIYLVKILIYTFFPGVSDLYDLSFIEYNYLLRPYKDPRNIISILFMTTSHVSCFYTCGDKDFFYDDNFGPFLFPWRKFLITEPLARIAARKVVDEVEFKQREKLRAQGANYKKLQEVHIEYTSNKDIELITFGTIEIDNIKVSNYYPILGTFSTEFFTFYNNIEYRFPKYQDYFRSADGRINIKYDLDFRPTNYLQGIFHDHSKGQNEKYPMMPIYLDKNIQKQTISNKGFTFTNSARITPFKAEHEADIRKFREAEQRKLKEAEAAIAAGTVTREQKILKIKMDIESLNEESLAVAKSIVAEGAKYPNSPEFPNNPEFKSLQARFSDLSKEIVRKREEKDALEKSSGGGSIRKNKRKTAKRKSYRRKHTSRSRRLSRK